MMIKSRKMRLRLVGSGGRSVCGTNAVRHNFYVCIHMCGTKVWVTGAEEAAPQCCVRNTRIHVGPGVQLGGALGCQEHEMLLHIVAYLRSNTIGTPSQCGRLVGVTGAEEADQGRLSE